MVWGRTTRFIVYGAGGIGSTIGGHLFRTGYEVLLVGNSAHVDRINKSGLRLVTLDEVYVLKVSAYKKAEELIPFRDDDVLLLTAKSQHTLTCLGQLKNAGFPKSLPIFCVQNSICNEALVTRCFDRVYGVLVSVPAIFLEPGEVINPISRNNGLLEVGLYPSGSDELARMVADAFKKAGFGGGVNDFVMKAKAAKCLENLANAMLAITDDIGDSSQFMAAAREEAMKVWKAAGIEWEDHELFQKRIRSINGTTIVPKGYKKKPDSSSQSLMKGSGNIEAEQLNGDVVKLGRMLDIESPYNMILWRLADEMAQKRERPGKYTVEDITRLLSKERLVN